MDRLTTREFWNGNYEKELAARERHSAGSEVPPRKSLLKRIVRRSLGARLVDDLTSSYTEHVRWNVIYPRYLPKTPGAKVIEIGSAPGHHLVQLWKVFGYEPFGVEYAPGGAEINREIFAGVGIRRDNVIEADFFDEGFADAHREKFDIVISGGFIEHFQNAKDVVRRHLDLLKPGGYVAVSIPNFRGLNYLLLRLLQHEVIPMHNFEIMRLNAFRGLFCPRQVECLFCRYFGTFSLGLFDGGDADVDRPLRRLVVGSKIFINPLLHLLPVQIDSRFTSPMLMYIGRKKSSAECGAAVT